MKNLIKKGNGPVEFEYWHDQWKVKRKSTPIGRGNVNSLVRAREFSEALDGTNEIRKSSSKGEWFKQAHNTKR